MLSIETANATYTGGSIYVFWGKLSDGTYYLGDSCEGDVLVLDTDPGESEEVWDEAFYPDWQEQHLIRYMGKVEAAAFLCDVCDCIIKNGCSDHSENYSKKELKEIKEVLWKDSYKQVSTERGRICLLKERLSAVEAENRGFYPAWYSKVLRESLYSKSEDMCHHVFATVKVET